MCIRDRVNSKQKVTVDLGEFRNTWKRYVDQLFFDSRLELLKTNCKTGPSILNEKIQVLIITMKDNKASLTTSIHNFWSFSMRNVCHCEVVRILSNVIYISVDLQRVKLPVSGWNRRLLHCVKSGAELYSNFRMVSLISDLLKLFPNTIRRRIF